MWVSIKTDWYTSRSLLHSTSRTPRTWSVSETCSRCVCSRSTSRVSGSRSVRRLARPRRARADELLALARAPAADRARRTGSSARRCRCRAQGASQAFMHRAEVAREFGGLFDLEVHADQGQVNREFVPRTAAGDQAAAVVVHALEDACRRGYTLGHDLEWSVEQDFCLMLVDVGRHR